MFEIPNRKLRRDRREAKSESLESTIQTIAIVQTHHKRRGAAVHLEGCTSLERLAPCLVVAEEILPSEPELGQLASCLAHVWQSVGEQIGRRLAISVSVTDLELEQLTRALAGERYYGIGWREGFWLPSGEGPQRVKREDWEGSAWYALAVRGTELHSANYFLTL